MNEVVVALILLTILIALVNFIKTFFNSTATIDLNENFLFCFAD